MLPGVTLTHKGLQKAGEKPEEDESAPHTMSRIEYVELCNLENR